MFRVIGVLLALLFLVLGMAAAFYVSVDSPKGRDIPTTILIGGASLTCTVWIITALSRV